MTLGVIGIKRGMTRIYADDGRAVPVTVVEVEPNRVTRVKSVESDGYRAVQVTTGTKHRNRINQPDAGVYAKLSVPAGRGLWEFRLNAVEGVELQTGAEIKVDIFSQGQLVDVTGVTIGKGFAGTIKRHNFSMGDATHGNSLSHRSPGSIGQRQTPGRVIKGKRMSGHMGDVRRTTQRLQVVQIDNERNLLMIEGAIPGAKGGDVLIKPSVKDRKNQQG
ncbi:MAG: 50S ribosomal protein L3 [Gammaproteobacteria bacterium]|nr:50S ribosomal protein L3 [Gammaproteobacteria bacterium]